MDSNIKTSELSSEFHAYWQCPHCKKVNIDIADEFLLEIKQFKCSNCEKEYSLRKKFVQILCKPLAVSF